MAQCLSLKGKVSVFLTGDSSRVKYLFLPLAYLFLSRVEFLFLPRVYLVRCFSKAGGVPVCVPGKMCLAVDLRFCCYDGCV